MHPAYSVIVFTVLSGVGYGLAAMLGLGVLDPASPATVFAYATALFLISVGLLSSTLHLGNPQRAWRAFSQWRSSWLSREGVAAVLTFVPLCLLALFALLGTHSALLGYVASAMCVFTVYCTAMIYASLKTVDAWHTWHTPACYLLFAAAGGLLLSVFFGYASGQPENLAFAALIILALAWIEKAIWRRRALRSNGPSTPETATGLGELGKVSLLETPHMTPNYLTREMGFRVARRHARKLWNMALISGAILPGAILLILAFGPRAGQSVGLALSFIACVGLVTGLLVERWLFFAEARHAVSNYYDKRG